MAPLRSRTLAPLGAGFFAALSMLFALAAALSPTAKRAFDVALGGTSWFLGLLFVMSALAAVRIFAAQGTGRWAGVVLPGTAALALALILAVGFTRDDTLTRGFIAASAIIGLPLAVWRGQVLRRAPASGGEPRTGSRF